ncbi:DUF2516 family protein [Klenkia sp. PcliD-1-E]|uniref:DUF2516 family protein n=1 Tax=Klenkia sp. PcliD-1-E TaxID=2954492 RepID=UPI002097AC3E|nr:DUF2516 family protein [Klenkia sp. PcliD-1-E]MCO7220476.1 DUF2516 family protein [Klenkia sp. PcliD-1-E]
MAGFDFALLELIRLAVVALGLWGLVDALLRPGPGYVAAGKLTKPAWVGITALATVVVYFRGAIDFLGLIAVVGIVVYLVDVRPAVRGVQRGNNNW